VISSQLQQMNYIKVLHYSEVLTVGNNQCCSPLLTLFYSSFKEIILVTIPFHVSISLFFTALHGMQMRSSDENSVRLSVRQTRAL